MPSAEKPLLGKPWCKVPVMALASLWLPLWVAGAFFFGVMAFRALAAEAANLGCQKMLLRACLWLPAWWRPCAFVCGLALAAQAGWVASPIHGAIRWSVTNFSAACCACVRSSADAPKDQALQTVRASGVPLKKRRRCARIQRHGTGNSTHATRG